MKNYLLYIVSLLFSIKGAAQSGHEINVTLTPFTNTYIYLGHYYGSQYPIVDSALLDAEGKAVFKGEKILPGGIYLIIFPNKSEYFEILVDKQQHFSVVADTATLHNQIRFENSSDNDLFFAYQQKMKTEGMKSSIARERLKTALNAQDSAVWNEQILDIGREINTYKENFIATHPNHLMTVYLKAMKEPEVPEHLLPPQILQDTIDYAQYVKQQYWKNVQFWDGRLAYTPFFDGKLEKYLNVYLPLHPDSVINELDYMLAYASINEEMNRFLLVKFINRYLKQKYMWEDAVLVHLYEKYIAGKHYNWLGENSRKTITNRALYLMKNIMGKPAENILLPDDAGNIQELYADTTATLTFLIFWDVTCGHCKEVLPKIDSLYQKKWKQQNIKIFAVSKETDGSPQLWKSFISDKKLTDWTHVYYSKQEESARINSGTPSYNQLYDIQSFPTLYLLDKEKRIVAKKLTYNQMDDVIQERMKQ